MGGKRAPQTASLAYYSPILDQTFMAFLFALKWLWYPWVEPKDTITLSSILQSHSGPNYHGIFHCFKMVVASMG